MSKTIEIFRSYNSEFFSTVGKFHLPCVRCYFHNNRVYLLPSCITAIMTGINIDFKYFTGSSLPPDIIAKYRKRGFGTLVNKIEKKMIIQYYNRTEKWNNIFGRLEISENCCKLLAFEKEDYKDNNTKIDNAKDNGNNNAKDNGNDNDKKNMNTIKDLQFVTTLDDLKQFYNEKYKCNVNEKVVDMFKLCSINKTGSINPLQSWVCEAFYSKFN